MAEIQSQELNEQILKEQYLIYLRQERLSKIINDDTKLKTIITPDMFKIFQKHKEQSENSMIRLDDIANYLRSTFRENKLKRPLNQLITQIKNFHISHGKEIWVNSRNLMNQIASEIIENSE